MIISLLIVFRIVRRDDAGRTAVDAAVVAAGHGALARVAVKRATAGRGGLGDCRGVFCGGGLRVRR